MIASRWDKETSKKPKLLGVADGQELIMKHSAFVGFPIDLRMEHRKAGGFVGELGSFEPGVRRKKLKRKEHQRREERQRT